MKYIEKFQYITQDHPHLSHIDQVQLACEAGAKWIQYRCFRKTDEALLSEIKPIATICDDWGTTLIVNAHTQFNGLADIQGFHIADSSTNFKELRQLVGSDITLGGSANTIEDLIKLANQGVDYAFIGPFSATGDNNSLQPDNYAKVIAQLKLSNVTLPILASGDIKIDDVAALMEAGIYGIAVAEAINFADDFTEAYLAFYDAVKR